VAGPYSSWLDPNKTQASPDGILENIQNARKVAKVLWQNKIPALCPHLNTYMMDGVVHGDVFLKGDLLMLSRCDAMFVLPNYKFSKGTLGEIQFCEDYDIPYYFLASCEKQHVEQAIKDYLSDEGIYLTDG
jgi:hypothetical protein